MKILGCLIKNRLYSCNNNNLIFDFDLEIKFIARVVSNESCVLMD